MLALQKPNPTSADPLSRRSPATIQRKATSAAPGALAGDIARRTKGLPLEGPAKAIAGKVEQATGSHLADVRLHTGPEADQSSRQLGAAAYTTGSDVHFASGAFAPETKQGQSLLAHELVHTVQQNRSQDGGRPQPMASVSEPGDAAEKEADSIASGIFEPNFHQSITQSPTGAVSRQTVDTSTYPKVVTIGNEKVRVGSADEEKEAKQIIESIKELYGIEISSPLGVAAIKQQYTNVPATVTNTLVTKEWEMKELRALQSALAHFAPLLGANRSGLYSLLYGGQEITSASKVDQAIDTNTAAGQLDTTTLGEFFKGSKNFSMFTAGTNSTVDFTDNQKQLEGTAIHEIAHGLMAGYVDAFMKATGYWTDRKTKSGSGEAPITAYGGKNASEDLSETVMYYFVDPKTLKTKCPIRFQWMEFVVKVWWKMLSPQKENKTKDWGDFPMPQGDTRYA
ncbi:MAG: DUF4157 domain-containing protein [Myxococcales bacterium]|nr:DUF4157 domain-containing protein [Myxococcales bacterium]